MASNGGRTGPLWTAAVEQVYRRARLTGQTTCGLCGRHVDLRLPYRDPTTQQINRRSKSVDHIQPVAAGGDLYALANLQIAHIECQWKQGGAIRGHESKQQARARRHNRGRGRGRRADNGNRTRPRSRRW